MDRNQDACGEGGEHAWGRGGEGRGGGGVPLAPSILASHIRDAHVRYIQEGHKRTGGLGRWRNKKYQQSEKGAYKGELTLAVLQHPLPLFPVPL